MSLLQALQRRKVLRKSGFLNYISIPNDQSKAYHQATKINLSSGKTFQQAINDGDFACYVEQGRSCGSCGGRIKCDGTCSVSTPNNYGRSCGGNSCTNSGRIRCSGSCGGTSYKPSGTSCGTNKECDGSGSCVSVSTPPPPPTPTCDKSQGSTTRCDGVYEVTDYTDSDCSDERTYCTHGCSGGSCNSAPPICNSLSTCKALTVSPSDEDKWESSGNSFRVDCPSGYKGISCTKDLWGGGSYDNPNDDDVPLCWVYRSSCEIGCVETYWWWPGDSRECGVKGSCTCIDNRVPSTTVYGSDDTFSGSGWKKIKLNCPSGYNAAFCTDSLYDSTGSYRANPGDGDESRCSVHSTYCNIECRERHTGLGDNYECGVQGYCGCIDIPS